MIDYIQLRMVGIGLVIFSLIAAYTLHFQHFYEFLVVGLFLFLHSYRASRLSKNQYIYLIKRFAIAGLIADLIFGLSVAHFWRYGYGSVFEYITLYVLIYPVAGLVMAQSFILAKSVTSPQELTKPLLRQPLYKRSMVSTGIVAIFFGTAAIILGSRIDTVVAFVTGACFIISWISLRTQKRGGPTLFDYLKKYPRGILAALLIATYFNAFLHELPNTSAHQWTYLNWPPVGWELFNVPISILLFLWTFLALYPVATYYSMQSHRQRYK